MSAPQNIIALIFDFDDTLTDDSTTKLLETYGIDPIDFWNVKAKKRLEEEWDPTLAYLDLLLDYIGEGKPFGNLTNIDLRKFGETLSFYSGIPELFESLVGVVSQYTISRPSIEFYIISGGIEEIIHGCNIARYFTGIWGCRFEEKDSKICRIKNSISFTEKTKFIFNINKGFGDNVRKNPYCVNEYIDSTVRRVPFENMIYVGDGLTDVPCFSLINRFGGKAFGVFNPNRKDSPKKAWEKLVVPKRVVSMNSPKYGESDDLGSLLRVAVNEICLHLETKSHSAV